MDAGGKGGLILGMGGAEEETKQIGKGFAWSRDLTIQEGQETR